jgi:Protein of unknown function (DUF3568)
MSQRRIALGLVVACGAWPVGCATVTPKAKPIVDIPVGPSKASYAAGRASQDFAMPPGPVGNAVAEAMEDLKMTSIQRGRDGTVNKIDSKTADGQVVTVTIRYHKPMSRVSCRIGWFGDEPLSRTLLDRIGVRLGTLPPAAIPENPPSRPASNPIFARDAVPDSVMFRDIAEAPYRDRVVP